MSFREVKETARAALHATMAFSAICYKAGPEGATETVSVRKHSKTVPAGDLAGTSLAYAQQREQNPRLICLAAEHTPRRGYVYALEVGDVYLADHIDPPDGITVTINCVALSAADAAAYPGPA